MTILIFAIILCIKSEKLTSESNESTMKMVGKIYSVIILLLTSILTLPILANLIEVLDCDAFSYNHKYICWSYTHIILIAIGIIALAIFIVFCMVSFAFGQYANLFPQAPWSLRTIYVPIIKFIKRIALVVAQTTHKKLQSVVFLALSSMLDIALLGDLLAKEAYYYSYVQNIELISAAIMLWWDIAVMCSVVTA